jgi:ATP-dependent protease ClpP protease subunit
MANKGSWFRIDAAAAIPTIYIYDEIGLFGVNADDFRKELAALGKLDGKTLRVRLNSPGGDVFVGWTIMSLIRNTGAARIEVFVDGVAASMASAIAMMGDHVTMAEGAMMMIHNPATFAGGDSEELRAAATLLDTIGEGLITAYSKKSGLSREAIAKIMDDETWLTAEEAVAKGFADEVGEVIKAAAKFDLSRYGRNPPKATAEANKEVTMTKEEMEALAGAIGSAVTAANKPVLDAIAALKPEAKAEGEPSTKTEKEIRDEINAENAARSADITDLCVLAGVPNLAGEYIAGTKTVAEVRADLKTKKAAAATAMSRTGINNHGKGPNTAGAADDEAEDLSDLIPKARASSDIWAQFNSVGRNGRRATAH